MLQDVAGCCRVLQGGAKCCRRLQGVAAIVVITAFFSSAASVMVDVKSTLQPTATRNRNTSNRNAPHCNTRKQTAGHYSTLQDTTTHCASTNNLKLPCNVLQHPCATHCNTTHCITLQHTATHCNILQHAATNCNTLQHTATHCNTLRHTAPKCSTSRSSVISTRFSLPHRHTEWQRPAEWLISIGHFPQKRPIIHRSVSENDPQLKGILRVFATLYHINEI